MFEKQRLAKLYPYQYIHNVITRILNDCDKINQKMRAKYTWAIFKEMLLLTTKDDKLSLPKEVTDIVSPGVGLLFPILEEVGVVDSGIKNVATALTF